MADKRIHNLAKEKIMKLSIGDMAPATVLETIRGDHLAVPDSSARIVHLQFRRFAGCPVCNFHLLTFARRREDLEAAGIREVVLFHSSRDEMLKYQAQLPFDCVADPAKQHYRRFGVETSRLSVLHPRVFWSGLRWILATGRFYKKAENGILGLPADFLIDPQGRIVAAKYGLHADDHWDVDELLSLASNMSTAPQPSRTPGSSRTTGRCSCAH
jgi:peroxiredoxin